ncbi:MAG: adenylate/guanylate cyclase domain-containing protein [Actinomycetota bacterium]
MKAFLFTDIEGSTRLWEEHEADMRSTLAAHDAILDAAVAGAGGEVFKHTGDGAAAVFGSVTDAAVAAVDAQIRLRDADWGAVDALRVRMGIHWGDAESRVNDYFGRAVNKAARLMDAASGGQVVLSAFAADELTHDSSGISVRDLGTHQLKDLSEAERVMQLCHAELESDFAPLSSVSRVPRNLPALAEGFLGREDELGFLRTMLEKSRLVTLTGTGGVGKTQLAIALAERMIDRRPDGAWFCDTSDLRTPGGVAARLNSVLSIDAAADGDSTVQLREGISSKRLTLVLDNVESGSAGVGDMVTKLVDECPNIHVICTSRAVLGIRGEQTMMVNPLPVPADDDDLDSVHESPSVELFLRRATDANPYFVADHTNLGAIARICRRLDGLPLGVELAAAHMNVIDAADLENQLAKGLDTIDDRGRTLQSVVAMSYGALSHEERALFRRLGVFHGGFSFRAASRMADDRFAEPMALLSGLVRKSVIFVDTTWTGPGTRYRMLSLLRDFAREQLQATGELATALDDHIEVCLTDARRASELLLTDEEASAAIGLDADLANFRAAHRYALDTERTAIALELVGALARFALQATRYELCTWAEDSLRRPNARTDMPGSGAALALTGVAASISGDLDAAQRLCAEAVARSENFGEEELAFALEMQAKTAVLVTDHETVAGASDRCRALGGDIAQRVAPAMSSYTALAAARSGAPAAAADHAQRAVDAARTGGCPTMQALALYASAVAEEDAARSLELLTEATEHAESVRNRFVIGLTLQLMMWKRARLDSDDADTEGIVRSVGYWYRVANWTNLDQSLKMMVSALAVRAPRDLLAVVSGWLDHRGEIAGTTAMVQSGSYPAAVQTLRDALGSDAFEAAAKRGRSYSVGDIVELCRAELAEIS